MNCCHCSYVPVRLDNLIIPRSNTCTFQLLFWGPSFHWLGYRLSRLGLEESFVIPSRFLSTAEPSLPQSHYVVCVWCFMTFKWGITSYFYALRSSRYIAMVTGYVRVPTSEPTFEPTFETTSDQSAWIVYMIKSCIQICLFYFWPCNSHYGE